MPLWNHVEGVMGAVVAAASCALLITAADAARPETVESFTTAPARRPSFLRALSAAAALFIVRWFLLLPRSLARSVRVSECGLKL